MYADDAYFRTVLIGRRRPCCLRSEPAASALSPSKTGCFQDGCSWNDRAASLIKKRLGLTGKILSVNNTVKSGVDKKSATGLSMGCRVAVDARQNPPWHADVDTFGMIIKQDPVNLDYRP